MIYDRPLTAQQRTISQKNYNRYNAINGASYMCLGETVIILFAVKLHAPDFVVALIGSMMFLGFLLLPLGVLRTARRGAAQSQADFWVCRNISAMLVALSAVIGQFNLTLAWGIMLLGAFLFYGFRAAGVVMSQPLIGDITSSSDRARLIARSTGLFYISGLAALLVISLLLKFDSIWILTLIIAAGATLGVTASAFIRKIDETSAIRKSASLPLLPQLSRAFNDRVLRNQIYAGFLINLAVIMLAPISVLVVKRGYGMSDTQAIIFSLAQFAAAIAGTQISGKIIEKFSSYKLMLWAYCLIFPVCLFWMTAPAEISTQWVFLLPFLLIGALSISMQNAMTHYFLGSVPKERQVASALFISLTTGALGGVSGMVLSGGLLKLSGWIFDSGLWVYRGYFAGTAIIFLLGIRFMRRLKN